MATLQIDALLTQATDLQASDLHLTVGLPPMVRVWGRLRRLTDEPLAPEDTFQLAMSMVTAGQKQRFEKEWELDFSYAVKGVGRFRVNLFRQRGSIGIAARAIPERIPSIDELGLPAALKDLTRKPRGLVLVTGPTGQGKSTSLAAMLDQINSERSVHIVTIEDPIEYLHVHKRSMVNQRELGFDTQTFPNALRAVLREDPNVIMVGEMRDLETIAAALTIAETGHLVFATLHTANAAQSIDRIIDVFPPHQQQQIRVQLAQVVEAVISQQLLPRSHGTVGRGDDPEGLPTGRFGRVAAVELMLATPAIRNLIREAKTHQIQSTIQTSGQLGMQTMDQDLYNLFLRRVITLEDAMGRAINPEELRKMIDRGEPIGTRRA